MHGVLFKTMKDDKERYVAWREKKKGKWLTLSHILQGTFGGNGTFRVLSL